MIFKRIIFIYLCLAVCGIANAGYNDTPKYWKCYNKTGGSWVYGRAPNVCDFTPFISQDYVLSEYHDLVFDDSTNISAERVRYMTKLHAVIKEMAVYYLNERKPSASETEKKAWIEAVYAIANQESYWSHYRKPSSGRYQYMRGDYGHGHGLFQVDDRWHFAAVKDGRAANLIMNGIYSLEEYYAAWRRAPNTWCIDSPTDYYNIARAAYSAYNGGPSKICRWTNPNDKWARNDKGYKQKLDAKGWRKYISDFSAPSVIDPACVVGGGEKCRVGSISTGPKEGELYALNDGRSCIFDGESFQCVGDSEDLSCMMSKYSTQFSGDEEAQKISDEIIEEHKTNDWERHSLCGEGVSQLVRVGESIRLQKNINLRKTPGGSLLLTVPNGSTVQVLDYVVKSYPELKRYYKVIYDGKVGFFYAGTESSNRSWAVKTTPVKERVIPIGGDMITIISPNGVAYYKDGVRKGLIAHKEKLVVSSVQPVNSSIYLLVEYGDEEVVIYVGEIDPEIDLDDIFKFYDPSDDYYEAKLINRVWYMNVRSCQSTKCSVAGVLEGPRVSSKSFTVVVDDKVSDWVKISQGSTLGWIKRHYMDSIE